MLRYKYYIVTKNTRKMQIIPGSQGKRLANQISDINGYQLLNTKIEHFSDGELNIKILDQVTAKEILIVQSTSMPTNDNFMELLLLSDAALRAGAQNITAIVPYLCYSRQDNIRSEKDQQGDAHSYEPLSANLVARMIESSGISKLITIDLHSDKAQEYFNIPVINLTPCIIFQDIINNYIQKKDLVIISPDSGGIKRAKDFSLKHNIDFVYMEKYRDDDNQCVISDIIGPSVNGKDCILIDDIVDTGGTIIKAAQILSKHGAKSIIACTTHPVLSGDATRRLQDSLIEKFYVSDSITHQRPLPDKFHIVPICQSVASVFA